MSEKTIFKKIIDRELPADIVFEDELCLAFTDINPAAPTHILVIPKKPIDRPQNMEESDRELMGHLFWAAKQITTERGITDYRLVMNNGAGVGQSVFHVHLHILAGRDLSWPPG